MEAKYKSIKFEDEDVWTVLGPWMEVPEGTCGAPGKYRPHIAKCKSEAWAKLITRLLNESGV